MRMWGGTVGNNVRDDIRGHYGAGGRAESFGAPFGHQYVGYQYVGYQSFTLATDTNYAPHNARSEAATPVDPQQSVVVPAVTLPSVDAPGIRRMSGAPGASEASEPDAWLIGAGGQVRGRQGAYSLLGDGPQRHWQGESDRHRGWSDDPAGRATASGYHRSAGHNPRAAVADRQAAESNGPLPDLDYIPEPDPVSRLPFTPRPATPRRQLAVQDRISPTGEADERPRRARGVLRQEQRHDAAIVFIPARQTISRQTPSAHSVRRGFASMGGRLGAVARRPLLISALVLVVVLLAALVNVTGAAQHAGTFSASAWHAISGEDTATANAPTPAPLASSALVAPQVFDANHYINKYGFFQPEVPSAIAADTIARLEQMLPAAIKATTAYNKRYGQSVEPQLLLYWTYSEGIGARINYSDCANEPSPPKKTYTSDIENCDHASFWQLGYGNQFGVIYVLRNAFTDLYGDPNDTQLVAKVGQSVLDYDAQAGTTPPCGGYSCTFPAKTIDEILTGVDLTTGVKAEGNWWASVLSRDPLINCYMIAHALTFFNHDATRNWVGCYYTTPCWQRDSDKLGDILAAWPDLVKAAGIQG